MKLAYRAAGRDEGRSVHCILKGEMKLSAERIKRLKRADAVEVDGVRVFTSYRVRAGQIVTADLDAAERAPEFPPERGELDILFENEALLAVNKPAGLLTHPSRGKFTGTLANFAAGYLAEKTGNPALHAVNRLDRDTSGVTLFAKNAHFAALTAQALKEPEAEKTYTAYLCGALPERRGVIDLPIDREREGAQRRVVRDTGRRAVTEYETVWTGEILGRTVSEARLTLRTGRTHQIRVHCAHLGAPVLGDRLYGDEVSAELSDKLGLTAHLLHAGRLTFREPVKNELLTLTAPVKREDMLKIETFIGKEYDFPEKK